MTFYLDKYTVFDMKKSSIYSMNRIFIVAVFLLTSFAFAHAQDIPTFIGGGGDMFWSNSDNWLNGYKPAEGEFSVVISSDVIIDEDVLVTNLGYANGTYSVTIQAGKKLEITQNHVWIGNAFILEDGAQLLSLSEGHAKVLKKVVAYDPENHSMEFIASPIIEPITPSYENGFITNPATGYNLFSFDENNHQWMDFKESPFDLERGQGYLYVNALDTILEFEGTVSSLSVEINLNYHSNNGSLAGYNLVGNPFPCNAYSNRSYFALDDSGNALLAVAASSSVAIPPCQGIFVKAESVTDDILFSKSSNSQSNDNLGYINFVLTKHNAPEFILDNAILSFNSGDDLGEVLILENQPSLYFSKDSKDYGIISVDSVDVQPVKFKAAEDGSYTMHVEPIDREVAYMHLIDNMTGANIDLLEQPEYTFDALTSDYASRFKLILDPHYGIEEDDSSTSSGAFAYYANGEIIINDVETCPGASLQIIDMMGRVVVTHVGDAINRVSTIGLAKGVYVLRLNTIHGVRTQKMVIE